MDNFDAIGMECISAYSPTRVALVAILRTVFGLLIGFMGGLTIWGAANGEFKPARPGDLPNWWMYVVGAAFALGGLNLVIGGIGRFFGAFVRGCYLRAGPGGIAIRMPVFGWFGVFRVAEFQLPWDQVRQIVRIVHRHFDIPITTELRIETWSGRTISIERRLFADTPATIRQKLLTIQSAVGD